MMRDRQGRQMPGHHFSSISHLPFTPIHPGREYITCVVDVPGAVAECVAAALWGKKFINKNL